MKAGFTTLALALLVGLVLAAAATAKPGTHVSGTYSVIDLGTTTCEPMGTSPNLLRCDTTGFVSQYSGDMTGTAVADFTQLIDCKTGATRGKGIETFTGTVAGIGAGTLTWHDHFRATTDCATFAMSDFVLKANHFRGGGALAGLHGRIDFTLTDYDGRLH
jgi:opacity protein-like surface antigen